MIRPIYSNCITCTVSVNIVQSVEEFNIASRYTKNILPRGYTDEIVQCPKYYMVDISKKHTHQRENKLRIAVRTSTIRICVLLLAQATICNSNGKYLSIKVV